MSTEQYAAVTTSPEGASMTTSIGIDLEDLARTGYSIMSTEWNCLGLGSSDTTNVTTTAATSKAAAEAVKSNDNHDDTLNKNDITTTIFHVDPQHTVETGDIGQLQRRITAIFATRCAAIIAATHHHEEYPDLSTQTICRTILLRQQQQQTLSSSFSDPPPPTTTTTVLTPKVLGQLSEFVRRMIMGYKDVPYHNRKHAYHVVLSTTKLMDMMVLSGARTYGIKHDPIALFAMVFAALIHDVEHQGIPNRQLALEDDRLAVLYNDQSMAENWSLYVAFSEFLQDEFADLRNALFNKDCMDPNDDNASVTQLSEQLEYRRFRKLVINLVLSTDLASPERTQIGKSKWKEAFGDPYETLERKLREVAAATLAENQQQHPANPHNNSNNITFHRGRGQRRGSLLNTTRMLTIAPGRRGSAISAMSSSPNSHNHNHNNNNNNNNNNNSGLTNDMDEDDSLSGTPDDTEESGGDDDNNDDEDEDDMNHNVTIAPKFLADVVATTVVMGGGVDQSNSNLALRDKFERRMSASSVQSSKYRQRLGILRTVDLSGETIETYSRRGSMATAKSNQSESVDGSAAAANHHQQSVLMIMDEPDELKATVVMETIMTAADVAHNLQSWSHMVKWSGRLYMELRRAHVAKRGFDPQEKWFENQIGFLESYLLPLARRLEDTGVFGDTLGQMFAATVEANRDRWLTNGLDETQKIIAVGNKRYPPKN